jgi:hypothetical protein
MNKWIILMILIVIAYFIYSRYGKSIRESFSMYEDESRVIRYGDVITIWSPSVNKFLQADPTVGNKMKSGIPMGKINLSNSLIGPEDIPSTMDWVQYTIIDASDPGDLGNTGPVKYGSPVFLRTINLQDGTFLPTYISPNTDNNVYMSAQRYDGDPKKSEQLLIFESVSGLQDSDIQYGDMAIIKTWRKDMKYIHVSRANDIILSDSSAITRNFYIYDRFGQGKNMDWARRGTTAQSSTNNNLFSQFAIDGNMLTFSSTAKGEKPWWEVTLPNDVIISRITISNTNDVNQIQLSNFDIKLYDFDGTSVDSKTYSDNVSSKYSWESVNQIARKVRIILNKNDVLNLADVRVYGQAVNYSVLLNEEMSKNLISTKVFQPNTTSVFKHRTLPSVSKDMTIMFLLELDKLPSETSNIFIKSRNIDTNRTPNLLINPPKLNTAYSTLQYIVTTGAGNNQLGENFIINYNVVPNKKFHFTAVHDAGINKNNGWTPCKFSSKSSYGNGTYLCNFSTREFYKVIIEESVVFAKESVLELDSPDNYGFSMKGLYNDKMSISTIKIYINGILNTTYELKSDIKYNTDSLNIGAYSKYSGFSGEMSYLKFSNRIIPQDYIQKESQILTGKLSIRLLTETKQFTTGSNLKFDPNYLPEINGTKPEYTIHFWLNSQRPITGTGNDDSIVQYGLEGIYFHSNGNTLYTKTNTGETGIPDSVYKIDIDRWIHIAYIIKDNNLGMYVNGKQVSSKSLEGNEFKKNSFSIINIGGFNGYLADVQFCNYGLEVKDLRAILNNNPNSDAIEKVRSSFNKAGCIGDPIDIADPYVDNYNSSWINFASKNDDSKLLSSITEFKKLADEGISSGDIIKTKLAEKCYGKVNIKMAQSVKSNEGIKCLPKAPFTCKKYNIDDFDIRTHKNFPKYVEKSKIRPPPTPVTKITTLPPDPLKYISTDSKEFLEMKAQLQNMTKELKETNKLKELVKKCKSNDENLSKMTGQLKTMKGISSVNGEDNKLRMDIRRLDNELMNLHKVASKDSQKLIGKISSRDLDPLKISVNETISEFSNTDRITPFSKGTGVTLDKRTNDLGNIEKMVHSDLINIDKKLDLLNKKISNQKMSNLEMATLNNKIASIRQNKM